MYRVAIDESGSHEGAPALVVAACLMTSTQWGHFGREWGPTARKYPKGFHATDAVPEDRERLADVLDRRLEVAMAISIDYEEFKALVPQKIKSAFGSEYVSGIRAIAVTLAGWCEKNRINWLAYILEVGHKGEGSAKQFFDEIVRRPHTHVFSHTWVGKENLITHAPDLIAYELARCYGKPHSATLTRLEPRLLCTHFDRESLASAAETGMGTLKAYERLRDKVKAMKRMQRRQRGR
jgi:hypothetical protein